MDSPPPVSSFLKVASGEYGAQFGKYNLRECVGQGAIAKVFCAEQTGAMGFRKQVALKLIHDHVARNPKVVHSLINEARVGGTLHHRNIVDVYEFDQLDGTYYMVMEFIRGHTLAEILKRINNQGGLPARVITQIAIQICDGLAHAHNATNPDGVNVGLVHRDLKPQNLMISSDGVVKITDFGIAKANTNLFNTTGANITKGTPNYMSPEQIQGHALDGRSDLFSLGTILGEMIVGRMIFQKTHLRATLGRIIKTDTGDLFGTIDRRFPKMTPIIRRALQRDPGDRYETAAEMGAALRDVQSYLTGKQELAPWLAEWMKGGDPAIPTVIQHEDRPDSHTVRWGDEDSGSGYSIIELSLEEEVHWSDSLEESSGDLETSEPTSYKRLDRLVASPPQPGPMLDFLPVSQGAFLMGSPASEPGHDDDEHQHVVQFTQGFQIATTPVTQGLYEEIIGYNPSRSPNADCPVDMVSWLDAIRFCNELSLDEGLEPAYAINRDQVTWRYDADGFRLPTEAEWEAAARAGELTVFAGAEIPQDVAWYWHNAKGHSHPVATKKPNRWSMYDMCGNVWEWVWDRYGPYPKDRVTIDPMGPEEGDMRLARGGSWYSMDAEIRIACRMCRLHPSDRNQFMGFRVARNAR